MLMRTKNKLMKEGGGRGERTVQRMHKTGNNKRREKFVKREGKRENFGSYLAMDLRRKTIKNLFITVIIFYFFYFFYLMAAFFLAEHEPLEWRPGIECQSKSSFMHFYP